MRDTAQINSAIEKIEAGMSFLDFDEQQLTERPLLAKLLLRLLALISPDSGALVTTDSELASVRCQMAGEFGSFMQARLVHSVLEHMLYEWACPDHSDPTRSATHHLQQQQQQQHDEQLLSALDQCLSAAEMAPLFSAVSAPNTALLSSSPPAPAAPAAAAPSDSSQPPHLPAAGGAAGGGAGAAAGGGAAGGVDVGDGSCVLGLSAVGASQHLSHPLSSSSSSSSAAAAAAENDNHSALLRLPAAVEQQLQQLCEQLLQQATQQLSPTVNTTHSGTLLQRLEALLSACTAVQLNSCSSLDQLAQLNSGRQLRQQAELVHQLQTKQLKLITDYQLKYVSESREIDIEHVTCSLKALEMKAHVTELQIRDSTYSDSMVRAALKAAGDRLRSRCHQLQQQLQNSRQQLQLYTDSGEQLQQLVQRYQQLSKQLAQKRWLLKEMDTM